MNFRNDPRVMIGSSSPLSEAELKRFSSVIEASPLAIYNKENDRYSLIPASTRPVILSDSSWQNIYQDSNLVLSAMNKIAAWLCDDEQTKLWHTLFSPLSPLEQIVAKAARNKPAALATVRFDLFFEEDELFIIECNSTIPAMQAYSDMVREALFASWNCPHDPNRQSNTQDLLDSLLGHYQRTGGSLDRPRIAIVSREGDSQRAELKWFQSKWQNQGYETFLATPDEIEIKGGSLWLGSTPIDLTYRHIFAHRLLPQSSFAKACTESEFYKIFNPISAHLEVKGLLAELSRAAQNESLSQATRLTYDEREAVNRRVVWSRLLRSGPSVSGDDEAIPDLVSWVKAEKNSLIVKTSMGYGGQGVFVGSSFEDDASQRRVRLLMGTDRCVSWRSFIDFCLTSGLGQWIVQKKIKGRQMKHMILSQGTVVEKSPFVDCSIYTRSGIDPKISGGACRFAMDDIVNIGQGGGLAPLLLESELAATLRFREAESSSNHS